MCLKESEADYLARADAFFKTVLVSRKNNLQRALRRRKARESLASDMMRNAIRPVPTTPTASSRRAARASLVKKAIYQLPSYDQNIILLRYWAQKSNVEIARMLGISPQKASYKRRRAEERQTGLLL